MEAERWEKIAKEVEIEEVVRDLIRFFESTGPRPIHLVQRGLSLLVDIERGRYDLGK